MLAHLPDMDADPLHFDELAIRSASASGGSASSRGGTGTKKGPHQDGAKYAK